MDGSGRYLKVRGGRASYCDKPFAPCKRMTGGSVLARTGSSLMDAKRRPSRVRLPRANRVPHDFVLKNGMPAAVAAVLSFASKVASGRPSRGASSSQKKDLPTKTKMS